MELQLLQLLLLLLTPLLLPLHLLLLLLLLLFPLLLLLRLLLLLLLLSLVEEARSHCSNVGISFARNHNTINRQCICDCDCTVPRKRTDIQRASSLYGAGLLKCTTTSKTRTR